MMQSFSLMCACDWICNNYHEESAQVSLLKFIELVDFVQLFYCVHCLGLRVNSFNIHKFHVCLVFQLF